TGVPGIGGCGGGFSDADEAAGNVLERGFSGSGGKRGEVDATGLDIVGGAADRIAGGGSGGAESEAGGATGGFAGGQHAGATLGRGVEAGAIAVARIAR